MATEVANNPNASQMGQTPAHLLTYNPNPRTVTWERLETMRLHKLGLPNKYSRHFNVLRQSMPRNMGVGEDPLDNRSRDYTTVVTGSYGGQANSNMSLTRARTTLGRLDAGILKKANSLAPFATVGKPTCGFFFSRETDNRKIKFGIPPSDLVKWRHFGNPQN